MLASDLKSGTIFKEGNVPFAVEKYEHTKTARGGATVKVRARNVISGNISTFNYKGGDRVADADILRKNLQYLYHDNNFVFMDPDTFEQILLTAEQIGDNAGFLLEGLPFQILFFEGNPVSLELPNNMIFEITDTVPGAKGNTVSAVLKEATISTGEIVKVPLFVKTGDKVKVDTRTKEYISRA